MHPCIRGFIIPAFIALGLLVLSSLNFDLFFNLSVLEWALPQFRPSIFNINQGSQFTSEVFTDWLESTNITISRNGSASYFDNIFIERLWRCVKYEEVYLSGYDSMNTANSRLRDYFIFYNRDRFHQSLVYRKPSRQRIASAVEIPTRHIPTNFRRWNLTRLRRISILKPPSFLSKECGHVYCD